MLMLFTSVIRVVLCDEVENNWGSMKVIVGSVANKSVMTKI